MKKAQLILASLAVLAAAHAASGQASMELQVVGSAGNVAQTASGATLHYTVGEMIVREEKNGAVLSQGFHQILVEKAVLSTETIAVAANVQVYPNPAKDFLQVNTDTPLFATLLDLNGRQVIQPTNVETTAELNVSMLPAGTYLLQSVTPDGRPVQNFKIQIIR